MYLFLMVSAADLLSVVSDNGNLHTLFKPFLLVALCLFYIASQRANERKVSILVLMALLFSWFGDILLLRQETTKYFILGLAAFLLAHIFYILAYRQHRWKGATGLLATQKVRLSFPVILTGTGLIVILYGRLGDFRIPVIVYALILMIMVTEALFRYGQTSSRSFWCVSVGAALFMLSDSLIAVNKFQKVIDNASFYVMATYLMAQYLIILGLINHETKKSHPGLR